MFEATEPMFVHKGHRVEIGNNLTSQDNAIRSHVASLPPIKTPAIYINNKEVPFSSSFAHAWQQGKLADAVRKYIDELRNSEVKAGLLKLSGQIVSCTLIELDTTLKKVECLSPLSGSIRMYLRQ